MCLLRRALLFVAVIRELLSYELTERRRGFNGVLERLKQAPARRRRRDFEFDQICRAVDTVTCVYFKPVRCLQRSVVTTRVLRKYGLPAEVVIGYRPIPFISHAWVELNGRVVNDSKTYRDRLNVLMRL